MQKMEAETEAKKQFEAVLPFEPIEMTLKAKNERLAAGKADFWAFDKIYFPAEMYSDGYSEPGAFHDKLLAIADTPGVQIILAARKHGKTATFKKYFVWLILTGKIHFGATLSSTLPVSCDILADIAELLHSDRIAYDFKIDFVEENTRQITMRIPGIRGSSRITAASEGVSVRGKTKMFMRPEFILCDDIETRQSPMGEQQTTARINIISEAFQSMGERGTLLVLGNNFDEKCAMNRLLIEQNEKLLPAHWRVHVFPAWDGRKPLWPERFNYRTEATLRKALKAFDEAEWQGDFQQNPVPPDGFIFKRLAPIPTWTVIPTDAKGVVYCDPNLAKRGKGDYTAVVSLLYSPTEDKYYVTNVVCRSFSDSNKLLESVHKSLSRQHRALGFDGHVNQESTWTNFVRAYSRKINAPFPTIKYCRYHTDELAKNIQSVWNEGRILLPPDLTDTDDGKRFLTQVIAFSGKRAGLHDDAPDALICAFELLHERKLARRRSLAGANISIIKNGIF